MTDPMISEETLRETSRSTPKYGIFLVFLAIIILIGVFGFGYYQLFKVNVSLAQMLTNLQTHTASNQTAIDTLQTSVTSLTQSMQKVDDLSQQQQKQLDEWRAAEKGDLNKWHVAEAQYLVKLANDNLQYTHNFMLALTLLQRAQQVLENLPDVNLQPIRQTLTEEIKTIQSIPQLDETSLYLHLDALNKQIDQLPLPASPLQAEDKPTKLNTQGLSWFKAGLLHTWDALRKIVLVKYTGSQSMPLVLPDEKIFLYQNLHAQLEGAMWALLHRNAEIYQADLSRASDWIKKYFVQSSPESQALLQNLDELRKVNIQLPAKNLSDTLQLLDTYIADSRQAQPAQ